MRTIERIQANSHVLKFDVREGWEQWLLLTADHHWDNPKCNRDLLSDHLTRAKQRGALVFVFGDLLCLMQGKYDPRRSKGDVRPEHLRSDYLDAVIKDAAGWYSDFLPNLAFISHGNHEQNIKNRLETSPLDRLVERLNIAGGNVSLGSYGGWLRMQFANGTRRQSLKLNYFHGSGGGGPVTKGVIQDQRRAAFVEGADISIKGHVHELTMTTQTKEYTDIRDRPRTRNVFALTTSTYKEEYNAGGKGWHVERGAPPKPLGSWWVRLYYNGRKGRLTDNPEPMIKFEVISCV